MTNADPRLHDPTFLLEQDACLRALARKLVHDAALADDVVQETWLRALRGVHRADSRVGAWLAGITRFVAFGKRRENARRARRESESEPPSPAPSTETLLARETARRAVADAVMQLAEPARAVVVLRFFDDLPPRAIAARLGIPVETVRTRIKRAIEQLRRELDQRSGGDGHAWCAALAPIAFAPKAAASTLAIASIAAALVVGTLGVMTWNASSVPDASNTVIAQQSGSEKPSTEGGAGAPAAVAPVQDANPTRVAIDAAAIAPAAAFSDVTGHVVDDAGTPIADARVTLALRHLDEKNEPSRDHATTTTERDGGFKFAAAPLCGGKPDDSSRDTIVVLHSDFVKHQQPLETRAGSTITLPRPARLIGTVRDKTTLAPIARVPLTLLKYSGYNNRNQETVARTTSDDAGRYAFLAHRRSVAAVIAQQSGSAPTVVETRLDDSFETTLDIFVPTSTSVLIEASDATSGVPLPGIEMQSNMFVDGALTPIATTGADGRARVRCVAETGAAFVAKLPGSQLVVHIRTGRLSATAPELVIPLVVPRAWTARGVLVNADGSAIAGATVQLDRRLSNHFVQSDAMASVTHSAIPTSLEFSRSTDGSRAQTAADGSFVLSDLLPGIPTAALIARRANGAGAEYSLGVIEWPTPGSDHDLGRIVINKTGALYVEVTGPIGPAKNVTVVAQHEATGARETWAADVDTVFDGTFLRRDLAPGIWTLTASAPGLVPSKPWRTLIEEDFRANAQIKLIDERAEVITRGQVLGPAGSPAPFAPIWARVGEQTFGDETDAQGRFEIKTPSTLAEPLHFCFLTLFPICVGTATAGATDVVVRQPRLANFRVRFVDAAGKAITTPVAIEWKDGDQFREMENDSDFTPPASGILEYAWPEGPLTVRVRRSRWRSAARDAQTIVVDLAVKANDDASAPTIVVP